MTLGLLFAEQVLWSGNYNTKGQREDHSFFILKKVEAAPAFFVQPVFAIQALGMYSNIRGFAGYRHRISLPPISWHD